MPLITRLFIKSGLLYFLISLGFGVMIQVDSLQFSGMSPMFWHALMVGWITQIIIGVSTWMFPGRIKEESFINQKWEWIAFLGLNTGLPLRFLAEPMASAFEPSVWSYLLIASSILQFIGILSYVIGIWPRVQSKQQRRQKRAKASG
ncbi:MAG: hypothetical protein U5K71_00425 [Gracilimonas sp.]|nr:hypothetical protein [Gracilimonas sp.]